MGRPNQPFRDDEPHPSEALDDEPGAERRAGAGAFDGDEEPAAIVPIEDAIDLHGFQPRDIPSVVEEYLRAAAEKGFVEVRLIHGRGTGLQRRRVREVLAASPYVDRFSDAPGNRGGWGATLVWLKPLAGAHRGRD